MRALHVWLPAWPDLFERSNACRSRRCGRVQYKSGVTVQSVEETSTGVRIRAVDLAGNPQEFYGERVFLGAGVLNTTTILLRSLGMYDTPVQLRDSQYYLLPLLRLRGTADVMREPLHTLAQIFVEILTAR